MGSNGAFYSNVALTKLNNAYSDFLCARLDKLNEKALNDQARSIDEWSLGHPLPLMAGYSTEWHTSWKGRTR